MLCVSAALAGVDQMAEGRDFTQQALVPKLMGNCLLCHHEFYVKEGAISMMRDCLDRGACPNCILKMRNAKQLYHGSWKFALPCIVCEQYFEVPFDERNMYGTSSAKLLAAQKECVCGDCAEIVAQRRAAKRARVEAAAVAVGASADGGGDAAVHATSEVAATGSQGGGVPATPVQ